jgi:hypothetical protein
MMLAIITHFILFVFLFIYYLLCSDCSGSICEASCGSMMPAIIVYYLLFISCLLSRNCSGIMCEASRGSMMPAISIYYLFLIYDLFLIYYLDPTAAACIA